MKVGACVLLVALLAGCGKSPEPIKSNEFFVHWLKEHGETNIVVDSAGVGIAGNQTRLSASLYGSKKLNTGYSVEVEYKISLPTGGPILEYVAAAGKTQEEAMDEAGANFVLTTAHVIYKAFINSADEHQRSKSVLIDGKPRDLLAGNMIQFGEQTSGAIDLETLSAQIQDLVVARPLPSGPHWIKVIYSQIHSKPMVVAVSLDNRDSAEMTTAVQNLKWPPREQFYMVKQFIVVK
jgi:hypothetical protein